MTYKHLCLAMTLMGLSLLARNLHAQEVDPSWFNPWPEQAEITAHAAVPQLTESKIAAKTVPGTLKLQAASVHEREALTADKAAADKSTAGKSTANKSSARAMQEFASARIDPGVPNGDWTSAFATEERGRVSRKMQ
jgi:hypothetical protein